MATTEELAMYVIGGVGGGVIVCGLLIYALRNYQRLNAIFTSATAGMKPPGISSDLIIPEIVLQYGPAVFFVALLVVFISMYFHYQNEFRYRETPQDIAIVKTAKRTTLASSIESLPTLPQSLTNELTNSTFMVTGITPVRRAMLNFRPLCVQNAGYLGGLNEKNPYQDGVYDVNTSTDTGQAISLSLRTGAKAFMFHIDYLDSTPCSPLLIYRDRAGIKRSLNTGSFSQAITQLNAQAFNDSYDPILLILYFQRVPPEPDQYKKFFKAVALSLNAIAPRHLGQTALGSFNRCQGESRLFTTSITEFQKKFIVITNVNTFDYDLPNVANPKESLHFYTNARIFADINANDKSILGPVTILPPQNTTASVVVGSLRDYITKVDANLTTLQNAARGQFIIALRPPEITISDDDMAKLLNVCQIQCIPLDVLNLATTEKHRQALSRSNAPTNSSELALPGNVSGDPLAYWRYMGWTPKITRIENQPGATDYRFWYVIPTPEAPSAPSISTSAAGGLVNIGA